LPLGEFEDIVAAVDDHHMVWPPLFDNIAGALKAVLVKQALGGLGTLVIATDGIGALEAELPPGIGLVGGVVTQLGHVPQAVVGDRRALGPAVQAEAATAGPRGAGDCQQTTIEPRP